MDWKLSDLPMRGWSVIFKHSECCDLSAEAEEEVFETIRTTGVELPVWTVTVQESPELSQEIAEHFGIRHATPQIIVLKDGQPIAVRTHGAITSQWLRTVIV